MSLDEFRSMVKADNATLLGVTLQRLEGMMDAKFADQEARFAKEISTLQKGIEQLELRPRDRAARDHAASRRHDDEERHTVVFSGFTAKSRKRLLIDYVKLQLPVVGRLAGHADVLDFGDKVFTPSIRTNIAMTRLPNKTALFKFLNAWKQADEAGLISKIGDEEMVIRVKRDKPPALRRADGKLWQLFTHLKKPWTQ